jgi:hypothetical protein
MENAEANIENVFTSDFNIELFGPVESWAEIRIWGRDRQEVGPKY